MRERRTEIDWGKYGSPGNMFIAGILVGCLMGFFLGWATTKHDNRHWKKLDPSCLVKMEKECKRR